MFALNSLYLFSLFRIFLSRPEKKTLTKPAAAMYCAVVEQLTDAKA